MTTLNLLKKGQDKCGGFACARLGHADEVLASKDTWNRLFLDGRRFAEAHVVQRPQKLSFEFQCFKAHASKGTPQRILRHAQGRGESHGV